MLHCYTFDNMQASTKSNLKSKGSKKKSTAVPVPQEFKTFNGYCKQYNIVFFATTTEKTHISEMWKQIQSEMAIDLPQLTTYADMVTYLNQKNASASMKNAFRYQYFLSKFGQYQAMYCKFVSDYNHNIFCVKRFMKSLSVSSMDTFKIRLDHILRVCNHEDAHDQEHEEWMTFARYIVHFIEDEMQRDPTMSNPLIC